MERALRTEAVIARAIETRKRGERLDAVVDETMKTTAIAIRKTQAALRAAHR